MLPKGPKWASPFDAGASALGPMQHQFSVPRPSLITVGPHLAGKSQEVDAEEGLKTQPGAISHLAQGAGVRLV